MSQRLGSTGPGGSVTPVFDHLGVAEELYDEMRCDILLLGRFDAGRTYNPFFGSTASL
jgi:hypothetical protein